MPFYDSDRPVQERDSWVRDPELRRAWGWN